MAKYILNRKEVSENEFYVMTGLTITDVSELTTIEYRELDKLSKDSSIILSVKDNNRMDSILDEVQKYQQQNGGRNKEADKISENFGNPIMDKELAGIADDEQPYKDTCNKIDENNTRYYIDFPDNALVELLKKPIPTKCKMAINEVLINRQQPYDVKLPLSGLLYEYSLGIKEEEGKLDYSEINLELLDLMAKRFSDNKHKYPPGNSKKQMDRDKLLQAMFRHIRRMIQPVKNDPETFKDHLIAISCNCSMILDQINLQESK